MKRITWWPQVFLGITFNWGALLGWMSVSNNFSSVYPLFLYIACIFWTIGYDTIYAYQDLKDDKKNIAVVIFILLEARGLSFVLFTLLS